MTAESSSIDGPYSITEKPLIIPDGESRYRSLASGSVRVIPLGDALGAIECAYFYDEKLKRSVIRDIALLKYIGLKPVVVHGGGKEISSLLERLGKETVFVDGLRVTDAETASVAEMVLSGSIGKSLVESLESLGIESCGINGKDGHTLVARKKVDDKGRDLGFVGEIEKVDIHLIDTLLSSGYVPVISPVGVDSYSQTYNINADYAASAIAGALNAQKLVFLTDVEGILRDKDDPSSIIRRMNAAEAKALLQLVERYSVDLVLNAHSCEGAPTLLAPSEFNYRTHVERGLRACDTVNPALFRAGLRPDPGTGFQPGKQVNLNNLFSLASGALALTLECTVWNNLSFEQMLDVNFVTLETMLESGLTDPFVDRKNLLR